MAEKDKEKETTEEKEDGLTLETKEDLINIIKSLKTDVQTLKDVQQSAATKEPEKEEKEEKEDETVEDLDEIESMLKGI